jgi:hypothetical protein
MSIVTLAKPSLAPNAAIHVGAYIALCVATFLPLVVAYQLPPQPTFVNQILAALLWAIATALLLVTLTRKKTTRFSSAVRMWLAFWGLMAAAMALCVILGNTPLFIAAPALGTVLFILLFGWIAANLPRPMLRFCFLAICVGLVIAATINALIATLQIAAPSWHDDLWIAALQGNRAYGNLRQPNLLALLSLFGLVATFALFSRQRLIAFAIVLPLTFAVIASGSRAGMIGLALLGCVWLAKWVVQRNGFTERLRRAIAIAVVALGAIALILLLVALVGSHDARAASTQHRLLLWQNVLSVIAMDPWLGVGFAQLNFAWTLTPLAARAPDVFDHAHNFVLQWAVEFGIPVAVGLCVLLTATLYTCVVDKAVPWRGSVLAIVAVALLHSAVEFPLWFLHFLLPVSALVSLLVAAVGRGQESITMAASHSGAARNSALRYALAASLVVFAVGTTIYYWRGATQVEVIYSNTRDTERSTARAKNASAHALLGHYGDYALIMLAGDDAAVTLFKRTTRTLIDERLILAWARAYEREGDTAKANFLFARAREFPMLRDQIGTPSTGTSERREAASKPLSARDFRN